MIEINKLNRWLGPPLAAVLLAAGTVSAAFASAPASPSAVPSCQKERGRPPERPIPPGQLVRRGVVGNVVGVNTEDGTITVETQFGNVEIAVPEGFDLVPELVGSRIAGLMEKEPELVEGVPAEAGTDTPFRVSRALRIKVIPTQVTRSHDRAVVQSQDEDTLEIIDEEGQVGELEVTGEGGVQVAPDEEPTPEATPGEEGAPEPVVEGEEIEEGTDAILLTRCTGPGATPQIRSIQSAERLARRLERLQAKFAERNPEKATKLADLQQKWRERQEARLQRMADKAPPEARGKVDKALRKAGGEDEEGGTPPEDKGKGQGQSGGGDKDKEPPESKGKPQDQGGGEGDSGQDEEEDKGPPEDKGGGKDKGKGKG